MGSELPGVGANRYAYAQNDPINNSDPNGHLVQSDRADSAGYTTSGTNWGGGRSGGNLRSGRGSGQSRAFGVEYTTSTQPSVTFGQPTFAAAQMDLYARDMEVYAPGVYAGSTGSRRPNGGLVGTAIGLGIGLGLANVLGLFNEEATDETPPDIPTIPEQAAELAKKIGKNTVNVPTEDGVRRYDLGGVERKGVPTPHVQESKLNVSPTGTHLNKDRSRKGVREITQKDIDDVKDFLGLK